MLLLEDCFTYYVGSRISKYIVNCKGQDLIEYAVILAIIVVIGALVLAFNQPLRDHINWIFIEGSTALLQNFVELSRVGHGWWKP